MRTRSPGAGRKPKPTHLKILEGNPGKRPLPKDEPTPKRPARPLPCLRNLSVGARKVWKEYANEIHSLGILTKHDELSYELLCESIANFRLARNGMHKSVVNPSKPEQALAFDGRSTPLSREARFWMGEARALLAEFGMTPSSRTRISTSIPREKDADPMSELLKAKVK